MALSDAEKARRKAKYAEKKAEKATLTQQRNDLARKVGRTKAQGGDIQPILDEIQDLGEQLEDTTDTMSDIRTESYKDTLQNLVPEEPTTDGSKLVEMLETDRTIVALKAEIMARQEDAVTITGEDPIKAMTIQKIGKFWHCIEYTIVGEMIIDVDYGDELLRADALNQFKIRAARTYFGIVPTKPGDE